MPVQLSFGDIFERAAFNEETRHLPRAKDEGITFYRGLIGRFNEVILAGDMKAAEALIAEAHNLAIKLNGGDVAIFADVTSVGNILERETAAPLGRVPLWGQISEGFVIQPMAGLNVRIVMEGMLGIARDPVSSFSAHAVDLEKPFISDTGYQSFIGWKFPFSPGMRPDDYVNTALARHIKRHLKGMLYMIEPSYRELHRESVQTFLQAQADLDRACVPA